MADYRLSQSGDEVQNILNNAAPVSSLQEETARAQQAEQQLQTNIESEAGARQGADATLQQNINSERSRAEDAEQALHNEVAGEAEARATAIAAERSRAEGAEDTLQDNIDEEAAARQGADTTLQQHIDAERTARIADVNEEETRAKSAENLLQQNIANETAARQQAVANEAEARASAVAGEASTRQQADTTLQGNISAEALARQQADATLQTNINSEATRAEAAEQALGTRVTTIEGKIPSDASPQNKLATEQFVNSTTSTATATFRGSYNEVSDLHLTTAATRAEIAAELGSVISGADNNDYAFVQIPTSDDTPNEIARVERYKFNGTAWAFEYELNNSGFTAAQWEAINSAITSGLVAKLSALPTNAELTTLLNGKQAVIDDLAAIRSGAQAGAVSAPQATTYTKTEVNELVGTEETRARGAESTLQQNINSEATARQQADTTLQGNIDDEETRAKAAEKANADDIDAIEAKIPSEASALNKLVDMGTLTQQMSGKQNVIDDLAAIRSGAAAGASAYQKPSSGIPDTDLTVELQLALASFITATAQNLAYYYLKSETYSASQVDQMLASIKQFQYESVAVLPEASAQTVGKIYLVPSADPKTQNTKDEYITLTTVEEGTTTYSWECIGSTTIDLSNYYTKTQADAAITSALNTALAAYSTTAQVGTMISSAINSALAAYATKEYVSSQVQEYAGTFRGTYDSLAELEATTGNHHNDYAWVRVTDSDGDNDYDRYKYNGSAWVFEYRLNNTHFTAAELDSIRSGMTTAKREKLDVLPTNDDLNTKFYALTRHTRLTDFDLNVLKQAVADQNLEKYGLKPGDQKTINGHTYVIAGLNPMKGTSTPYRVTANHVGLIVIPHTTQAWNASGNTSTGADSRGAGYMNCDLHYYLKNTLLPLVETDLGAANLIGHSKLLTNAVNTTGINRFGEATGCSSGWAWEADCKICALSEVQVYGGTVWSSSGYDTGEACRQLEVFQHFSHTEIFGGEYPWLRDVGSASDAAPADSAGHASYYTASYALSVAALILFH